MSLRKTLFPLLSWMLLIGSCALSMDKPKDKKPKQKKSTTRRIRTWIETAGNIMLGREPVQAIQEPAIQTSFAILPADIQFTIVDNLRTTSEAASFRQIAKALSTLERTEKHLYKLINDPTFCLRLIKYYAKMFNAHDTMICSFLNTQAAKTRLAIQDSFIREICTNNNPDTLRFRELVALGFDSYFTDLNGNTPIELCIRHYNTEGLKMLLSIGVNPEFVGNNEMTLYDLAASRSNRELATPMTQLLNDAIQKKHNLNN
jgi:hypothetical protein